MNQTEPSPNPRRSFRLRYSLRTLFVLVTVLSVGLGYMIYEAKRQRRIIAELEKMGAEITSFKDRKKPSWLPEVLDIWVLGRVRKVFVGQPINDVVVFGELKNLEWLVLRQTQVSDVSALSALKNLEVLDLEDAPVSDVSAVGKLEYLEQLYLDGTRVSDVSALAGLKKLKRLNIERTLVSDVSALGKLKNLALLELNASQVTDDDCKKLKECLPSCEIGL